MTRSVNAFGLYSLIVILIATGIYFLVRKDVPLLYINEFMANNSSCCPDQTSGKDEFDDWIEIYNPGKEAVDLAGMYLSQNEAKPLGYKIPSTAKELTTIQPGGYLIIWADGSPDQGILHLKFKLSQNGEYIGLYHQDGRKIDGLKFGRQQENISFGRRTDGSQHWQEFSTPTPGQSNQ